LRNQIVKAIVADACAFSMTGGSAAVVRVHHRAVAFEPHATQTKFNPKKLRQFSLHTSVLSSRR
jgi:hypothetical protein